MTTLRQAVHAIPRFGPIRDHPEAKGRKYGVVADTVHGRGWDTGVLIPGIKYDSVPEVPVRPPAELYARNAPNMDKAIIIKIQEALASTGFSPGEIDGEYGPEKHHAGAHPTSRSPAIHHPAATQFGISLGPGCSGSRYLVALPDTRM